MMICYVNAVGFFSPHQKFYRIEKNNDNLFITQCTKQCEDSGVNKREKNIIKDNSTREENKS